MSRINRISRIGLSHDEVFRDELADAVPYHRMYGKEYCVPSFVHYGETEVEAIRAAAESVDNVFWKALRFAQRFLPDSFLKTYLGLHPALLAAARVEVPFHGLSRQDWIVNEAGMKCIENNTDTPTGVPETAYLACELAKRHSPHPATSGGMRSAIRTAFAELIEHYRSNGLDGLIVFSSYGWHLEDRINVEYVRNAVGEAGYRTAYAPLEELEIVPGDGLYLNGERISILYRLYPLEYLVHDTEEATGEPVGRHLLKLVELGKLGLINPAQSIITQSKGFMALIWSLYERRDETEAYCGFQLFDAKDAKTIETYLLPAYYENTLFVRTGTPYVAKGYWGREGKGTALYDDAGRLLLDEWGAEDGETPETRQYYERQPKMYQRLFPMQELTIETEDGPYTGYLLTGAFVVGGRYCGLLPRVGGKITGDMAYYCPAIIHKGGTVG